MNNLPSSPASDKSTFWVVLNHFHLLYLPPCRQLRSAFQLLFCTPNNLSIRIKWYHLLAEKPLWCSFNLGTKAQSLAWNAKLLCFSLFLSKLVKPWTSVHAWNTLVSFYSQVYALFFSACSFADLSFILQCSLQQELVPVLNYSGFPYHMPCLDGTCHDFHLWICVIRAYAPLSDVIKPNDELLIIPCKRMSVAPTVDFSGLSLMLRNSDSWLCELVTLQYGRQIKDYISYLLLW